LKRFAAIIFSLVMFLTCCCNYLVFSQSATNQGKEFWTAYMAHNEDMGNLSSMSLYIASDVNTTGKVEVADNSFSIPFSVVAKKVTIIDIPRSAFLANRGKFLKGIHITALKNIVVYAHIYANNVSGATLLLPVNGLSREYLSINYYQRSNATVKYPAYSTFSVIATENNTTVEITPSALLLGGAPSNVKFTITLAKGEVYQGLSRSDLTNTVIKSVSGANGECKKIAVFSGSSRIGIGCEDGNSFSSDNLFQQVFPTSTWGKKYLTAPLRNRNYDIFRVILSDPTAIVKLNGEVLISMDLPYYEFKSNKANVIEADKPIQVVQYAVTQGNSIDDCTPITQDIGDPEMIYLSSVEQTLDHVTLYSPSKFNIVANYINVIMKTGKTSTLRLDGNSVTGFQIVPGDPEYSYAQIKVSSGTNNLTASEGFNAIAYGFGDHESYGYAAGTNLQNLNEHINFTNLQTNASQTNGCANVDYKLELTVPYQTNQIRWDFKDGTAPYIDNSPAVKSSQVKDGITLYTYQYYKTVKFPTGDYGITASVVNPQGNECGTETYIDFDFNISGFPQPRFTVEGVCLGTEIVFKDATDVSSVIIKDWYWDFGDGQTSTLQNPGHTYVSPGTYDVILTVVNNNGCPATITQKIKVLNNPVAAFEVKSTACIDLPLNIADRSIAADGTIKQWIWDFNDGTVETHTDNLPFSHTYTQLGTYSIKLTVVNENGCAGIHEFSITVEPLPVADFKLPDVCIADAFAQFFDLSTISNNTAQLFTYSWNFGDAKATVANSNTSTLKDPKHTYTEAGIYTVTLTVSSAGGCPQTKSRQFTVNGAKPKAKFTVENIGNLCSANEVVLQDQSTVDFGNITKIRIYNDYLNNPQLFEEFDRTTMPGDGKYRHVYTLTTYTKRYMIRMQAYSGGVCESIAEQEVEVKGNPTVTLTSATKLCAADAPIAITVSGNTFAGNGIFTGTGVTSAGVFDPKVSGPGTFTINYHFIASNGCDVTKTQQIEVSPLSAVNAGEDFTMLEGSTVKLKSIASGTDLTYKWTPAAGLDRDDILQPNASPATDVSYKLMVTTTSGCISADEIFVAVLKKPIVVNTFTPNGDGINDKWEIKYIESYPGSTIDIYNRQGEKVYSSVGYASPWDGKYKGDALPTGTYYYIINPKNGRKPFAGNVTIIR
jgi:gliding motility-associated-like protein